jgi:hypothetical protein
MQLSLRIAAGILTISLAVPAIKCCAYLLTTLESIINVVTAVGAIVAIRGQPVHLMRSTLMATTRPTTCQQSWNPNTCQQSWNQ